MTAYTARPRTIYFIRPVGEMGPVKIGCSKNPEKRLQQLSCIERRKLEILATVPGNMDDERRIQSTFWHDHLYNEWFGWSRMLHVVVAAAARGELDIDALPPARVRRMPWRDRKAA